MQQNREQALALLTEYTKSESLLKHSRAVEAAMRWYAQNNNLPADEVEKWGITGLLHDFDYEQHPLPEAPDGHPFFGNRILEELGYPQDIRDSIMGHANYSGVPRSSQMAKTLFAVDELCGFIVACSLVRPDKLIKNVEVKSVRKKLKTKEFARAVSREDIDQGALELGVDLDQHIANVIAALSDLT